MIFQDFRSSNLACRPLFINFDFFLKVMEEEPKDDSQQKIEIEKLQGELSSANQEIKKLQSEIKLSEEDRIQHRIMKGISKLVEIGLQKI